jgi:transposase
MAGRFEGLSDLEWKLFEDIFPTSDSRSRGMPHTPFRYVINSLLYILITECRWCDLPQGKIWASKSSAYAKRDVERSGAICEAVSFRNPLGLALIALSVSFRTSLVETMARRWNI